MLIDGDPPPFIVYALARSRTAWMARFLSYGAWTCHHEHAVYLRTVDDMRDFFAQPRTGTAETAVAPAWRLINHYAPGIRSVVVRRPVEDACAAMIAAGAAHGIRYDEPALHRVMAYENRLLDAIAAEPDVLELQHRDLEREDACAALFEFCLPYPFDRDWWARWRDENVQTDVGALTRYYYANRDGVEGFKTACKRELIRLAREGAFAPQRQQEALHAVR